MKKKIRSKMHTVETIPREILGDVFLRLSMKEILCCRCVCRTWFSIISDPHFANHHLNTVKELRSHKRRILIKNKSLLLYDNESDDGKHVKLPFCDESNKNMPEVLSSCNGLLLVGIGYQDHFLWNPSLGSYIHIPCENSHFKEGNTGCRDAKLYGLVYDSGTDTYKVIRIVRVTRKRRMIGKYVKITHYDFTTVKVYNCRTGSWKKISNSDFPYKAVLNGQGTLANGAPHWIVTCKDNVKEYVIIYYDTADDVFKEVKTCLPSWLNTKDTQFRFGVLRESLCLVDNKTYDADVWIMKEPAMSWNKLVTIKLVGGTTRELCSVFDQVTKNLMPLLFKKNGEDIIRFIRTSTKTERILQGTGRSCYQITYKLREWRLENDEINEDKMEDEIYWFDGPASDPVFNAVTYVASLLSPRI